MDESKVEEVKAQARVYYQKVTEILKRVEFLKVRLNRIKELYEDGFSDKETFLKSMGKVTAERKHYETELDLYQEKYDYFVDVLDKLKHPEKNVVIEVNDIAEKKKIVNKYIKSVYIERYEKTGTKIVINDDINYLYRPKKEGLIKL